MNKQTAIKVGKITYLNCLPFFYGLEESLGIKNAVSYSESYPSKINQLMRASEIDIAPISSMEYLENENNYSLIPELVIASRNFSGSVLLLSKNKLEELDGAKIAITDKSKSSAELIKILLSQKLEFRNDFEVTSSGLEDVFKKYEACLTIGDEAFFCQPKKMIYKYDLGEIWWNWTGKPFVFALWAVRKSFLEEYPEAVTDFCKSLKENTLRNLGDPERLVKDSLKIDFSDERFSRIFGYISNLEYFWNPETKEGLALFSDYSKKMIAGEKSRTEINK